MLWLVVVARVSHRDPESESDFSSSFSQSPPQQQYAFTGFNSPGFSRTNRCELQPRQPNHVHHLRVIKMRRARL